MRFPRRSGILLHPTSLPGPYGMGEIGPQARRFVDRLAAMKQSLWQILPLGPTGYADSPYQSLSTFAGNPLWISIELLAREGLVARSQIARFPTFPDSYVDYGNVIPARQKVIHSACRAFFSRAPKSKLLAFEQFCRRNAYWLEDFALFYTLKKHFDLKPWIQWPREYARRDRAALKEVRQTFKTEIRHTKLEQFLFADQWMRLRRYCHSRNIKIIGDIPIFVAHDSADVWAHPELFQLDDNGNPTVVAGVPPDYFSATGQLWGNPLYRWEVHRETGYAWWIQRMRHILSLVDIVRIDHFRGFEAYWEIPAGETTAVRGRWVPGPGAELFEAMRRELGHDLPIIAEDLGVITPDVERLRDQFEFPGMRILQFAFGNDAKAEDYRPESYPPNCVVYTGTHDNDTTVGWFNSKPGQFSTRSAEEIEKERQAVLKYLGTDGHEIHWDLISVALRSRANTAIIPLQDLLGLGSEARMNVPGTTGNNWKWRFRWDQLTPEIEERMRRLTEETGRAPA